MGLAAKAVGQVSQTESRLAAQGKLTSAALELSTASASQLTAGLTSLIGLATLAVKTFADDEQQIFRTTVVLKNLGNSFPIERAQAFASQIQKTIAVDDEAVVGLIGLEKRFGVLDNQIEPLTRSILDFSKATGTDLTEAGSIVGPGAPGADAGPAGAGDRASRRPATGRVMTAACWRS
jgi:hypothetical protein